jgi:hypothetical protein
LGMNFSRYEGTNVCEKFNHWADHGNDTNIRMVFYFHTVEIDATGLGALH